jgi:flagellar assembly protein FliH
MDQGQGMKQPHGPRKSEKFLFDMHVFDAPEPDDPAPVAEDIPPPPPVFSEDELEAVRAAAFAQGKAEGEALSRASREQQITNALERVARDMKSLFSGEDLREKTYELEAVALCERVFAHAFPLYAKKTGFEEMKAALRDVIARHNGAGHIRIRVAPDMAQGVEEFMNQISAQSADLRFTVQGEDALSANSCRLSWEYGGAVRDSEAMAREITAILQETLAGQGAKGHDSHEIHPDAQPARADENKGDAA